MLQVLNVPTHSRVHAPQVGFLISNSNESSKGVDRTLKFGNGVTRIKWPIELGYE